MTITKSNINCELNEDEIKALNIVYNLLDDVLSEMRNFDTLFANTNEYDADELDGARVLIEDLRNSKDGIITIDRS